MRVAAVIVTYRRYPELQKTIIALLDQGLSQSDIYVVDNNEENTRDLNFYTLYEGVRLLLTEQNIASAGGFAMGMRAAHLAGYEWLWMFNDDSRPVRGSYESVKPHLELSNSLKIGLIKIANINKEGKAILLNWKGVRKPSLTDPSDELISTDLVTFDGCMISKGLMDAIGYCDPQYFMGTYEFDYCLKGKEAGFGIYTIPNGKIEDGKLGSIGGTPPWRQYYNTRNHLWMGINRKDSTIVKAWIIREIKFVYAILRFEDQKIERLRFKALALYHALKGIRGKSISPGTKLNG